MSKQTPWLDSKGYLDLAAEAARRGMQGLAALWERRAHEATVAHEREKAEALEVIEKARRRDSEVEFQRACDELDAESARLAFISTPPAFVALASSLPRCA